MRAKYLVALFREVDGYTLSVARIIAAGILYRIMQSKQNKDHVEKGHRVVVDKVLASMTCLQDSSGVVHGPRKKLPLAKPY